MFRRLHSRHVLPAVRAGIVGFAVSGSLTLPAGAVRLDLAQAVDTTLRANPGLLSVEEIRSQVKGGIREARADAFPQLTISSSWGQSRNPSFLNSSDFDEILDQFPGGSFEPSTQELSRAVIEVKQPVWTFGKIRAAIDLAEIVGDAADAQIRTAELDAAFADRRGVLPRAGGARRPGDDRGRACVPQPRSGAYRGPPRDRRSDAARAAAGLLRARRGRTRSGAATGPGDGRRDALAAAPRPPTR